MVRLYTGVVAVYELCILHTARLRVDEKYLIPTITLDTTLEYLIPTTTEAGACTTALVDFLVLAHNEFIEKCWSTISKDEKK